MSRPVWQRPAAVVTAVAVVLAVVVVLVVTHRPQPAATSGPAASGPLSAAATSGLPTPTTSPISRDALSADEAALVARLPKGLVDADSCIPAPDQEDPVYTKASVRCQTLSAGSTVTAGAPTDILASLDRSPALLAKDLGNNFGGGGYGSDFATPPAAGKWRYPTDSANAPEVGSRWLYVDQGNDPHLDWCYDDASVFIDASGGTSTATTLSWFSAANLRLRSSPPRAGA